MICMVNDNNMQMAEYNGCGEIVGIRSDGNWIKIGDMICGTSEFINNFGCYIEGKTLGFPPRGDNNYLLIKFIITMVNYFEKEEGESMYQKGNEATLDPLWVQPCKEVKPIPRNRGQNILNITQNLL